MSTYKNTHVTKVCNSEKSGSIPMVKIETRERDILSSAHRRFAFALVGSGIFSEVHGRLTDIRTQRAVNHPPACILNTETHQSPPAVPLRQVNFGNSAPLSCYRQLSVLPMPFPIRIPNDQGIVIKGRNATHLTRHLTKPVHTDVSTDNVLPQPWIVFIL